MNASMTRRSIPLLLALFVLSPGIRGESARAAAFPVPGDLCILEDGEDAGMAGLSDLPVTLYLRIPPRYLVSVPPAARAEVESRGFTVHEIGRPGPGETLYLLSKPAGGAPGTPSGGRILFRSDDWILVAADDAAVERFGPDRYRFGIVPMRRLPMEAGVKKRTGAGTRNRVPMPAGIRAAAVGSDSTLTAYLERLQAFQTRYSRTDSVAAAAQWLHDMFTGFGYTDVVFDSFYVQGRWQRNVVATKVGSVSPDKVIVIGGHYDSVTYDGGCDPMTWAPGVDDDGSGTAMTLELARVLAGFDSEVTIRFVPFAAEEQGLYGSWHYAEEAFNAGMDIRFMINMDMIGNVSDGVPDVIINTDEPSMMYADLMIGFAESNTNLIPRIGSAGPASDHWPFQQYGYPFVYVEEGDFSPNWHRCTDTVDNVDVSYMVEIANMILPTIVTVANAPGEPTGFTARDVGDGTSFRLDWDPNPEPDVSGYEVWSGPEPGLYNRVDTTLVNTLLLTDLTAGDTLYVAVSAYDNDGYEGVAAGPVRIVPMVRPRAPVVLDVTSRSDRIEMAWLPNGELDLAGYVVYRMERGGTAMSPLDTLTTAQTSYSDGTALPGVYYLYEVTAIDDAGSESDPSETMRGRLATHDGGILVIDATRDGSGGAYSPTDEAVDSFYDDIFGSYIPTGAWDYADSLAAGRRPVGADLGFHSTVVWHRDDRFGEAIAPDTTQMAKYLDSGGNLLLGGWSFLTNLSEDVDDFSAGSFFHDYLKIVSFETTGSGDMDFIGAEGTGGDYPDVAIDPEKVPLGGLFSVNYFDVAPAAGAEIYRYASPGSPFDGEGMGIEYLGADFGVIVLGFPLFYLDAVDARALIENAMARFGESPTAIGDDGAGADGSLPRVFALGQNYPNPFNPSTTIAFAIPAGRTAVPTHVAVYDVRGRRVRTLVDGERDPGEYRVHWNGRDERGAPVASGVYLYTIEAGDFRATRKMVLTR